MSKHTPGPWEFATSLAGINRIIIESYDFGSIAAISVNGAPKAQDRLSADSPYHQDQTETMIANARLIAAAPDMLAALKEVFEKRQIDAETMAFVESVIQKAEGNEP